MENIIREINKEEINQRKILRPGEHIFSRRKLLTEHVLESEVKKFEYGNQVIVPEGYQVLSINTIDAPGKDAYMSSIYRSVILEIWYINVKRVELKPNYNFNMREYDYSEPGTVVETMVEEEAPTLGLRRNI